MVYLTMDSLAKDLSIDIFTTFICGRVVAASTDRRHQDVPHTVAHSTTARNFQAVVMSEYRLSEGKLCTCIACLCHHLHH